MNRDEALEYLIGLEQQARTLREDEFSTTDYARRVGVTTAQALKRLGTMEKNGLVSSRIVNIQGRLTRAWSLAQKEKNVSVS